MATYTDNYHLSKPETTDSQQSFIEDYATNMEIIDENMGGGSSGGGHTIVNPAGTDMPQESKMQFTGKVSVSDDATNEKTVVTLPEEVKEVTLAEYEALPDTKLTDDIAYFIKDVDDESVEGYPPLIYSDEEREVGVWRDGKPLYQKTIIGTSYSSSSASTNIQILNVDKMVLLEGTLYCGNSVTLPLQYQDGTNLFTGYFYDDHIELWNNGNITFSKPFAITIQYTKTTDTAGSGTWNGQGGLAHHYSTNETVVGTWIDGKPLYEKTVLLSNVTISANSSTNINISDYYSNVWKAINFECCDINGESIFPNIMVNSALSPYSLGITVDKGSDHITFTRGSGSNATISVYFTLRYTKTTD